MAGKKTAVFGIYKTRADLELAVDKLRTEGFLSGDISVLFPDTEGTKDFAHEKHTKAPEGTATGATTGAVIGGVLGWLTGIGALAIPGIGPLIAAGPIVSALAGLGAGGAVGGLAGALIGAGIPEYEAKRYEGRIHQGGILLSVHCDSSELVRRAKEVLVRTGATDIASAGEEAIDKSQREVVLERPSSLDTPRPSTPIVETRTEVREVRPASKVPPPANRPPDPNLPEDPETRIP